VKKGKLTETKGTTHFPQRSYRDQSARETEADRSAARRSDHHRGFDRALRGAQRGGHGVLPPARIRPGHTSPRGAAAGASRAHGAQREPMLR